MNPRVLVVVAACAVAAVCAYFFMGRSVNDPTLPAAAESGGQQGAGASSRPSEAANGSARAAAADGKSGKTKGKVNWEMLTTLDTNNARPAPTEAEILRFLAKHGETPANLVAAFESTGDRRWLDRALELFPNSPLVLMKAIDAVASKSSLKEGETYQANPEKLALIDRFKAADPKNPVPWILAAQELFKAKQTAEGIAEIRASLERPGFYIYANERMAAAQRLYESLGIGETEASAMAMFGLTLPHMSAAQQASRGLMEWQKTASESGDAASSDDALRLTYQLGRTFATPEASRLLIGQLVGISMEKRALEALPADSQPAWLSVDRTQRLAEIEKERELVKDVAKNAEWIMKSQDEQLVAEWLRRVREESEVAALRWVNAQRK